MIVSREYLARESDSTGFRVEILEKVLHLLHLLQSLNIHPFLKGKLALKGGSALNLFLFNLPRLSVDIDLNYIGSRTKNEMLAERPKLEKSIREVCSREGYTVRKMPEEHAGGKWQILYKSALGHGGKLEIDVNFMFRIPLWPVGLYDSIKVGRSRALGIPVIDVHELAAGKMAALFSRSAARDLFDVHRSLTHGKFTRECLRVAFVVYGAMNAKDWRNIRIESIHYNRKELKDELLPLLRADSFSNSWDEWADTTEKECRDRLGIVLPLSDGEKEFLDRLLDYGEIRPAILTEDEELADRIQNHPALEWKALNVRKHPR